MAYWISTALISTFLIVSAATYLLHMATIEGVRDLGFPDFFRIELAVLKLLAAAILLTPLIPVQIKEWAYAGVALFLITAIIAHYAHGDSFALHLINVFFLILLFVSNINLPR